MPKQTTITTFEHQILRTGKGEMGLTNDQLKSLQSYYGNGVPYFSLTHNGVQFNEYVGVIQVGETLIEVLPKADKYSNDKEAWRTLLIGMIRAISSFEIRSTSQAALKVKPNTILDLYFELFINEIEYLQHSGLLKKYHKKEGNNTSLKGNILFSKQIQKNIIHQELFFTRHTTYDVIHSLHKIIFKTIVLLRRINTNPALNNRISALLLNFPVMPDINVSEGLFNKIVLNRKSYAYKKAIEIGKMILLQYHPDVKKGKNDVLALMFDMNKLWEQFVYVSLKKKLKNHTIKKHISKSFWKPDVGRKTMMEPDIIIKNDRNEFFVLDTKWKNINNHSPSSDDLRQLYVYQHYYYAKKVALVYPGNFENRNGLYFDRNNTLSDKLCSIITLEENKNIKGWQVDIAKKIDTWTNE